MVEATTQQLVETQSVLIILLAACYQSLGTLEATDTILTIDLTTDLREMIERLEHELEAMTTKIRALAPSS